MCEWYLLRDNHQGVSLECELRFDLLLRVQVGFLWLLGTKASWAKWWGQVLGAVVGCSHSWGLRGQVLVCSSEVQHRYRNNVPRSIFTLTSVRAVCVVALSPTVSFATPVITLQIIILRVFSCCVCSEMPMMQQAWIFYRLFLLKLDIWNMPALSIPMNYWTTIIPGHLDIKMNKLMCSTQIQQESLTSAQWWPCGFLQGGVNRSL